MSGIAVLIFTTVVFANANSNTLSSVTSAPMGFLANAVRSDTSISYACLMIVRLLPP